MATTAEIADAVVAVLATVPGPIPVQAGRSWLPLADLTEMEALRVTVVPAGRTIAPAARDLLAHDHRIEIAVQKRLPSDTAADLDPLEALVERLALHLAHTPLGISGLAWVGSEHAPLVAHEHLNELRQFTSLLVVTYRSWETR
ncbi:MAG: hypothetical protein H0W83_12360 [Planctomycetes bacterium]|nr:hypothetical protein [Planctomycetota bacterium]